MDLYREEILDHYKNPRNFGDLPNAQVKVREANSSCGDMIEISLKFKNKVNKNKENSVIEDIRFKGLGCAISVAATSMLTEMVKGKTLEELKKINLEGLYKLFGGPVNPGRVKCLSLPLKALEKALKEYEKN